MTFVSAPRSPFLLFLLFLPVIMWELRREYIR